MGTIERGVQVDVPEVCEHCRRRSESESEAVVEKRLKSDQNHIVRPVASVHRYRQLFSSSTSRSLSRSSSRDLEALQKSDETEHVEENQEMAMSECERRRFLSDMKAMDA